MRIVYDIEKLKSELIGKVINWITITDVFKDENNHTMCRYICRCGISKVAPIKIINAGKIKSCGCYKHSKEFSEHISDWCKNNPDVVANRVCKFKEWVKENPDKLAEQAKRHSEFFANNSELINNYRERIIDLNKSSNKDRMKAFRADSFSTIINNTPSLNDVIHADDINNLISGNIRAEDKIRVRCPLCSEYSYHNVRDIFNISNASFKQARMCKKCFARFSSSTYEQEIANFISTFYNGECIKNDRSVLSGKELDLHYPEKKIAIEFNGDYWHSSLFKDNKYHFNKLKECLHRNILLVSIFESEWLNRRDSIESYLTDLFIGKNNSLSFISSTYVNNNYPHPHMLEKDLSYLELNYTYNNIVVHTCGCSKIINAYN